MKSVMLALLGLVLLSASAVAQEAPKPDSPKDPSRTIFAGTEKLHDNVDVREVIRRGDMVEHVTNDVEDADPLISAIGQIATTPENDNDKWYISVVSMEDGSCKGCIELKKQWATNQTLRAYAVPDNAKDSWAHFTWYDYNDKSQSWRWTQTPSNPKPIKIDAFPTIIVQPPRNGKYGKPSTIVLKYVYEGDPEDFHQRINKSIKLYVEKLQQRNSATHALELKAKAKPDKAVAPTEGGIGAAGDGIERGPTVAQAKETAPVVKTARKGIGQSSPNAEYQQVPPLDLPLDKPKRPAIVPSVEPEPQEETPVRNLISRGEPEIVIITDQQQRYGAEVTKAIESDVKEMQGGHRYRERQLDINQHAKQCKAYGVDPVDTPAVLRVENKRVVEKRTIRPNDTHEQDNIEFVAPLLFSFFSIFLSYSQAAAMTKVVHSLIYLVAFLVAMIIVGLLIFTLKNKEPSIQYVQMPAPGPAPSPGGNAATTLTKEEVLRMMDEAEQIKANRVASGK